MSPPSSAPCDRIATPARALGYRQTVQALGLLNRLFFRRIEVTGLEHIPATGGGIVVSWHPNAIVDGTLILTHFPRRIVFGARHGLFRWPILGWVMRHLGTVPIYRRQDVAPGEGDSVRPAANTQSLDALAWAVADGAFAALFPEGASHDEPYPQELKTGAARLFYRATELMSEIGVNPVIIPVGLHYDKKGLFGSNALVAFHPPLELDPELAEPPAPDASFEEARKKYRRLTDELERALHEVVHATESWELHHLLHRGRKLIRAERARRVGASLDRPDMAERQLGFARLWTGYRALMKTHPQGVGALLSRVGDYDRDLRAFGLHDHELDGNPRLRSHWVAAIFLLQLIMVYLLLPPILLVGFVANVPTALLVTAVSKGASRAGKDVASVKLLVGAVAFPFTWLVIAILVGAGVAVLHTIYPMIPNASFLTGVVAFFLSALGGFVVLHYQRLVQETLRAIRVRFTRARRTDAIQQLREERSELYDGMIGLSKGLELPGTLAKDGRVQEEKKGLRGFVWVEDGISG